MDLIDEAYLGGKYQKARKGNIMKKNRGGEVRGKSPKDQCLGVLMDRTASARKQKRALASIRKMEMLAADWTLIARKATSPEIREKASSLGEVIPSPNLTWDRKACCAVSRVEYAV